MQLLRKHSKDGGRKYPSGVSSSSSKALSIIFVFSRQLHVLANLGSVLGPFHILFISDICSVFTNDSYMAVFSVGSFLYHYAFHYNVVND